MSEVVGHSDDIALTLEKIQILEQKVRLREGLPFKYGWPVYSWARAFRTTKNKMRLLCAANQISKSSTNITLAIDWATDVGLWPDLWIRKPKQFWYLYPNKDTATIEFEKKWVPELLPRGEFKDHEQYGWKDEYKNKQIFALHFNTGVSIYFKTYSQDAEDLQTGSCDAIFCDEELPAELYPELSFRIVATDGYFSMVFTATLGQEFWRTAIEEIGTSDETFPEAFKLIVSMYDCLHYEDGTPSTWTIPRIKEVEAKCGSESERLRRVMGRFVAPQGRKYPAFERTKHFKPFHPVPETWFIYAGVDIGSGGKTGHPAAIVFVAVDPTLSKGRVIKCWRGDGIQTDSSDILRKFQQLRGNRHCVAQFYDWQAKDFDTIATRASETFTKAEKGHDIGEDILNTLFSNGMLVIYDTPDGESNKLANELGSLLKSTAKTKARDDLCDALRYAVTRIPWDWSVVGAPTAEAIEEEKEEDLDDRRNWGKDRQNHEAELEAEFDEANELYGV